LRQVAEATACNSSKVLLNLVVNGSDAMTDVEAVRHRLLVRTQRTREEDVSPPCQRSRPGRPPLDQETLDAALLLIKDRVIPEKILEHKSYA
jgi:hypothetical protein